MPETTHVDRPAPKLWASAHGLQACLAHGMRHSDYYLADAERIVRHRGRRGATVEVVGDLPSSSDFRLEWKLAGFTAEYHDYDPDMGRGHGNCGRCPQP